MITIRQMDISDYDSVMTLWGQTENLSLKDADSRASIAAYLAKNPGLSFVAIDGQDIVGAVLVGTDGRRGYLQHLAVDLHYRGQKIAQRLVQSATEALAQQGIAKTHLFVLSNNLSAQDFYLKLGWQARDEIRMFSFNSSDNQYV
ncbi:GNAT family N-acetyltransferase [Vibrio navarrensis]|uniref:GNAT family N-acetyltransferase n=1 Tax=Vibrio navarrensis TaxID=29495 RepID=UPI00186669F6|nr:GNAT family N-acetyltransferase [Vibrio navarrensis]EHA1123636.1 GNAT family N-acetyltransferase [Vibrio navarrensis]EJK2114036.1 GNAT family N-acetyltransferase [Vibrio navarrensis]MBE3666101.1 GNAT family N-acetyltransferase [Vibrio navarrensis]MBE4572286.1 GNAT family N-acetyltransferase [Vibrio navarrensis]MBE4577238.1 GNAT family N-acetyltransferase [Vibrio navarrensis]